MRHRANGVPISHLLQVHWMFLFPLRALQLVCCLQATLDRWVRFPQCRLQQSTACKARQRQRLPWATIYLHPYSKCCRTHRGRQYLRRCFGGQCGCSPPAWPRVCCPVSRPTFQSATRPPSPVRKPQAVCAGGIAMALLSILSQQP
jgi:hypothetical protein